MEKYVGLDVSMEETSVCVLDGGGNIVFEGKTSSQPDALSKLLRAKASDAARIVLETGSLASWLWHELRGRNFPVICLDARHVRAARKEREVAALTIHGGDHRVHELAFVFGPAASAVRASS